MTEQDQQADEAPIVVEGAGEIEREMMSTAPIAITGSIYENPVAFEHMQRVAKMFAASSQLVPQAYRKNIADCLIAVETSRQLGIHPLIFMQNSYLVHGKPALEGKLLIALMNTRGPFKHSLMFDFTGEKFKDDRTCKCWSVHKDTDSIVFEEMSIADSKRWGWYQKKDSAWPKDPDLMLRYRTAAFLCRTYCPELVMGFRTVDEALDMGQEGSTLAERISVENAN